MNRALHSAVDQQLDQARRRNEETKIQAELDDTVQPYQQQAIDVPQSRARQGLAPYNYQLLVSEDIFGLKPRALREPLPDGKQQLAQKRDNRPLDYHTHTRASSRIRLPRGAALTELCLRALQ